MKIVIAPDSFKESLSAAEAAAAMARGVRSVLPGAECVEVPMADGGEGTTDALVAALGGQRLSVPTMDALGRPLNAEIGLAGELAIVEVAASVGLALIAPAERDITRAHSGGIAPLLLAAADSGASRIILGLGGTATTDGGAGLVAGLGGRWLDAAGRELAPHPSALREVASLDLSRLDSRWQGLQIELACDVTNPLLGETGAAAVFGPQKGARPEQVPVLDALLSRLADAYAEATGRDVRDLPGSGAAGGLGAALLALGATMRRGVEVVAEAAGLDAAIAGADLVLTGEGSMDAQTASGKTPAGVAALARRHGVSVIGFAGRLGPGAEELIESGFTALVPVVRGPGTLAEALVEAGPNLERAVATALRLVVMGRQTDGPS